MQNKIATNHFLFFLFCLALILAFILLHSARCSDETRPFNNNSGNIVAKVNGKPIYESRVTREVDKQLQKFGRHGMRGTRPDLENRLRKNALKRIIDREILVQASQKVVIPDIDKRAREKLESMKTDLTSEKKFQQYLKARGMTARTLMISMKKDIRMNEYLKSRGLADSHVSEEETRGFYDQRKEVFKRKESVMVSHILVRVTNDADKEDIDRARQRVEDLRRRIAAGKDFAEIAKKHSDCIRTKQTGGDLGYIKRGFMPPKFDEVAFSLKMGQVSEVIETQFGYHIIRAVDKKPAGYVPLEDVKDFINKYLQREALRKEIALHTQKLRQKAKIEVF